ncbi:NFX1-type zinc finger-containing protein 1 [Elysia marginata]|uniref:NFX1-type zinc finger-containing protein 1 n=1 Tax=Elysia marginata TaxID=1093978 RepID=A0AAV4FXC6_9GAST|nr:NFX1-type zinc finger-containing protein 1 [Elysia marginata]
MSDDNNSVDSDSDEDMVSARARPSTTRPVSYRELTARSATQQPEGRVTTYQKQNQLQHHRPEAKNFVSYRDQDPPQLEATSIEGADATGRKHFERKRQNDTSRGQLQTRNGTLHPRANYRVQQKPQTGRGQIRSFEKRPSQKVASSNYGRASIPQRIDKWLAQPVATCLVFELSDAANDLSIYLKTTPEVPADTISRLVSLLQRAVFTYQKEAVNNIIRCVLDAYLLDGHFILFLDRQLRRQSLRSDTLQCLHQMLDVVEYAIKHCPEYGAKCNYSLQQIMEKGKQLALIAPDTRLLLQANKLINLSSPSQVQQDQEPFQYHHTNPDLLSRPGKRKGKIIPDHDESLPPDDFREICIFPDTEEIFNEVAPFLRANKTSGVYRDLQHYLDVHSRLLKEDYLEPIRHGLKDYKYALENETKVKEDNLRFYHNVKLIKMKCDDNRGITHLAQFSLDNGLTDIEWEFSRRLLFGSLLVLSKDMFQTTVFATVSDRKTTMLENGFVEITFHNNLEQIFTSSEFDLFLMAETTAYFESYRHVLEGLQEMRELPLSRYILSAEKHIYPPAYYIESPEVDMSCIASHGRCLAPVEILDEDDWPEVSSTILNASQMDALKLALTKEIAIIQGPPGTGKTYVGLKIMNILFKHMTRTGEKQAPILVVCYTNHALDQFLEGMLSFCNSGIVRVGGRSSSEALERFNLKELRKNPKTERSFKRQTDHLRKCRENLKTIASFINTYWQQSLKQETNILSLEELTEEIDSAHRHSLEDPQRLSGLNPHVVRVWLKATSANMENHMTKAAIRRLAQVIARGEHGTPDSAITNLLSAVRAEFLTRVQIYRYWAGIYKMRLETEIDQLMTSGATDEAQLHQLIQEQELATQDVLTDGKLIPLMGSEEMFGYIKESVEAESKGFDTSMETVVRQWLIGKFKSVDSVLDAIERLTDAKVSGTHHGKRPNTREVNTEDDFEESGYRRRHWVLADTSDEDESDDDLNDDSSYSDGRSMNGGIEDIDDFDEEERNRKLQFRDISRDFEQFQNREIQIYQRAQILGVDMTDQDPEDQEEEWQEGTNLSHGKVFKLLHSVFPFSEDEAADIKDVWNLSLRDRYRLYKYWVQLRKEKLTNRLIDLTKEYRKILAQKKDARNMKDVAILRSSRVIGMTTSGAAKHRAVLQRVASEIVVVEEAAEVLEAHIITALNAKVKHLILIGDHQQLRPNPTVYRLAIDYDLEISLFERLVKNGIPCVMLEEQHRMRPEISQFVRHIYPQLRDHGTVQFYGDIEGVASNVFFLQHDFEEKDVEDTSSKANTHEAQFLTALCKYFLQHGYEGFQITILAAYGGQVAAIKEAMEPEEDFYQHVRVTSIDNYQGEENDIILLSLVRSNKDNNVGFLKTDNRVCVALSRAKKGLFVIGNLKQLAFKSPLWKKILKTATEKRVTGSFLKLVCVNHKAHETYVSSREDFQRQVPEGGCSRPCGAVLKCGHVCNLTCHSWDRFHEQTECRQPCLRTCPEGHPCSLTCAEKCGPCRVPVKRVLSGCNHEDTVPCHVDVSQHLCTQPCLKMLPCGHECRGACGVCSANGKHALCTERVEKTWPTCGHRNMTECHKDPAVEPCETRCKEVLSCGHKCKGTCGGCLGGRVHMPCRSKCGKPLPCGHPCAGPCGGVCIPCGKRCPTRCRHGPCPRTTCGALCQPCLENCAMTCSHSNCSRRCLDECVSRPCTKTCGKPVEKCKHKCVSLCGERCVCFTCGKNDFQLIDTGNSRKRQPKQVMAHEQRERARKFELTPDTVLMKIPGCGHVFTLNQLDKYMESLDPDDSSFIKCPSPSCPTFLQQIRRYEHINKQRAERRHARKEKLIEDTKVRFPQLSQVRFSVAKVRSYCDIDEMRYLHSENIEEKIDPNEVHAFTLHARFAYVLLKIEQIDRKFNKQRVFNAFRWKQLILGAKRSCTPQFRDEMRLELHRLLLSHQLVILYQLLKDSYTLDDQTKSAIPSLKASFKDKMTERGLKNSQALMGHLFVKLQGREEEDYWHQMATSLKSRSLLICACLDEPVEKDLCAILEQHQSDSSSDQEDDSSSEDEGSSENDDSSEDDEPYSENESEN